MCAAVLSLGGARPAIAEEQILFNIFNPERAPDSNIFGHAKALDVSPSGEIYLLGTHVWRYKADGTFDLSVSHSRPLDIPVDVAVDSTGNVSVSRVFDPLGSHDVRIEKLPRGDDIVLARSVDIPLLALDGSNNLYVADAFPGRNREILKFNAAGNFSGAISVLSGPQDIALSGIDVTDTGTIFISDVNNNRAGRLDLTVPFLGVLIPFTTAGELDASGIAFDPARREVLVAAHDAQDDAISHIHRFNPTDGSLVSTRSIMGDVLDIDVDIYGSMYVVTENPNNLIGIDPTITADQLATAARAIVLNGLSFDNSPQGAHFRGLAVRAARTRNNLNSVSEAQSLLNELRVRANFDVEPPLDDVMSFEIEQINGFLTAVVANSPLVIGEGSLEPMTPPEMPGPTNPFTAFILGVLGAEPFYGRYHAGQPIGFPPPAHVDLTLDPATATSNFIKPGIWGRGNVVRPQVISSTISLDFNGLVPTVREFSMVLGSFDINGTPSGLNRGRLSPNGQLFSQFGRQGRDFEAHVEGWITNDLYPESRPIFTFLDLQGFIPSGDPNDDVTVYGVNEPMIVPGLPGQPPTNMAGIGFIATRAAFDQTTNTLRFNENTDPAKTPDLSVILTPQGVFAHGVGAGEPAVGAGFSLTPLVFTGLDAASGRYEFSDAVLTILGDGGPFATARLSDIGIDPAKLIFTGTLDLDEPTPRLDSPFVNTLRRGPAEILLLSPSGTLDLLTLTANFSRSGTSQTDFIVVGVVPEPSALSLCVGALVAIAGMALLHKLRRTVSPPSRATRQGQPVAIRPFRSNRRPGLAA